GTMLKITRLDNNKSVQVRVTDRGPFISGRVVEISRASAEAIGLVADGSARVKVEVAKEAKPEQAIAEAPKVTEEKPKEAEEKATPAEKEKEVASAKTEEKAKKADTKPKEEVAAKPKEASKEDKPVVVNQKPTAKESKHAEKSTAKGANSKAVLVKGSQYEPYDLFEIQLKKPEKKGFGVQVAVLSTQDALFKKIADLQEDWFDSILVSVQKGPKGDPVYKVILGAFESEKEATNYKANLKKNKKMDGFVVDLSALD
ncbi:MAG: SPOR domain-containing protein, partial [Saprospiraceae bacterium]|nr:SPOR domain-containing protein [Saprospiraceae bacterium]